MKLLFATRNRGKLAELTALVAPYGFEVISEGEVELPLVDEDRETFAGNAEKKARSAYAATGIPALADDSGLEVDALGGAPGVHSARYAAGDSHDSHDDRANNAKLLAALAEVPDEKRTARFRCTLAFVDGAGDALLTDGTCQGAIAHAPRGANGFGYDPLFLVADVAAGGGARTLAELTSEEKNRVSHRGLALVAMANALAKRQGIF